MLTLTVSIVFADTNSSGSFSKKYDAWTLADMEWTNDYPIDFDENYTMVLSFPSVIATNSSGTHVYHFHLFDNGTIGVDVQGIKIQVTLQGSGDDLNYTYSTYTVTDFDGASSTLKYTGYNVSSIAINRDSTHYSVYEGGEQVYQFVTSFDDLERIGVYTDDVYSPAGSGEYPASFSGAWYITVTGYDTTFPAMYIGMVGLATAVGIASVIKAIK